jgi:hypothetical protein
VTSLLHSMHLHRQRTGSLGGPGGVGEGWCGGGGGGGGGGDYRFSALFVHFPLKD